MTIKPITAPIKNIYGKKTGKFYSILFDNEGFGSTKEEAEQNLIKLLEWNLKPFRKYFQAGEHVAVLYSSPYNCNEYFYGYIREGKEQSIGIFSTDSQKEAIQKAQEYFTDYLKAI